MIHMKMKTVLLTNVNKVSKLLATIFKGDSEEGMQKNTFMKLLLWVSNEPPLNLVPI